MINNLLLTLNFNNTNSIKAYVYLFFTNKTSYSFDVELNLTHEIPQLILVAILFIR